MRTAVICTAAFFSFTTLPSDAKQNPLVAPGAQVQRIRGGFGFLEGPAAHPDGALYFTDIPNERIHRWTADGGLTTVRESSGRANGLRFDLDGNLLVCEMGNRRITLIDIAGNGDVTVLAERYEGERFNSPNDLWVDPKGGIYFSDPRYGSTDDQEITGYNVYYISPDRSEIRRIADDLVRPNGIVGAPDGSRLYIADHGAGRTFAYTPLENGSLTNKQLFAEQGADGMSMDEMGNVYLTGENITIYSPTGHLVSSIAVPEPPSNLTFGGPEGTTLFITARTSLYSVEMTVTGQ